MCDHDECKKLLIAPACVDEPIPYTLTELGRLGAREFSVFHFQFKCDHVFQLVGETVECSKCAFEQPAVRRPPRFSDLGRRGRAW